MTKSFSLKNLSRYLQQSGLESQVHNDVPIKSVCFHSKHCVPDSLFAALKGEHNDGHQFIDDALSHEASSVLVSQQWWQQHPQLHAQVSALVVSDTGKSLKILAKKHRDTQKITRIAITGSNGKTTVKEMLHAVLKLHTPSYCTPGNYNTAVALASSFFDIADDAKLAIFELGINEEGEMKELSDLVSPHLAVITNVGMAHSGNLGGREKIAQEKMKVFSCHRDLQTAIIPESSGELLVSSIPATTVYHGPTSTPGLKKIREGSLEFSQGTIDTSLQAKHEIYNALVVIRIAQVLNIPFPLIQKGLSSFSPLKGRGNISHGRNIVVEDWYNASPESMRASLSHFSHLESKGRRKVIVLGGMEELGDFAAVAHQQVVDSVSALRPDLCFLIGKEYHPFLGDAPSFLHYAENFDDLLRQIEIYVQEGDMVLIKGSRKFALETIAQYLLEDRMCHA